MKTQSTKMERVLSTLLVLTGLLMIGAFLAVHFDNAEIIELKREKGQVETMNTELRMRLERSEQTIATAARIVSSPGVACVGAVAGFLGLP